MRGGQLEVRPAVVGGEFERVVECPGPAVGGGGLGPKRSSRTPSATAGQRPFGSRLGVAVEASRCARAAAVRRLP